MEGYETVFQPVAARSALHGGQGVFDTTRLAAWTTAMGAFLTCVCTYVVTLLHYHCPKTALTGLYLVGAVHYTLDPPIDYRQALSNE